jgi:TonB family protein
MVAGASVPLYPPLARAANVQGVVHVKITTDGHGVSAAHVEDGHKLLAAAAEENARTWQFATHEPTTFTVTYHYRLDAKLKGNPNNPTVILRLPTEVEISTVPLVLDTTAGSGKPTTR